MGLCTGVTVEAPSIDPWLRDSVTVRCVGSTVDMTQMNLYKDDRMVTEDHSHQITRTHTTVELNINSVSDTDQGSYTCVKNDKTIYGQTTLRVIRRLRYIWIRASSTTVPVQGSVTLECSVEGFTNPQWLRRSSFNAPDFEILNVHTSIIHVTRGGVYSCRGEDTLIITKESDAVDIWETGQPLQMPSGARIRDTVTLRCVGPSNKHLHFYKDGVIMKPDTNHQFNRTSETTVEMIILSVSESDQGWYSCGIDGETLYTGQSLTIYTGRSINLSTDRFFIPERGGVRLSCQIQWIQKYQWIRRTSAHTSHFEILNEDTATISVHRGGVYSCRGKEELILTPESNFVDILETGRPLQMPSWACLRDSESDQGWYSCGIDGETLYTGQSLTIYTGRSINLSTDRFFIPERGGVRLSCQIQWIQKYQWIRRTSAHTSHFEILNEDTATISVHRGGVYSCRGKQELILTPESDFVTIWETVSNRAVVQPEPDWTEVFVGESLSLRCEVEDEGNTEWTYKWNRTGVMLPTTAREYVLSNVSESDSGDYSCRGTRGAYEQTQWSQVTKLQVTDKSVPVISASPSWLSPGVSVSLKCDVTAPSAGWRFYWYRAVPLPSGLYSYELLTGDTSGTAHASFSVHGLSSTRGFVCRAARGRHFYTEYSPPRFVWSADGGSRVAPDVVPNSSQHFIMDSVSVSCGPDSSDEEWTVQMFSLTTLSLQQCHSHTTEHKHTCEFSAPQETRAVFWCESGSGQMSDAVNITVHDAVILLIPVLPVPEGHDVSLTCKLGQSAAFSSVHFYKDGQLIQKGLSRQHNISAVSRSDQGSYKCELHDSAKKLQSSPESWASVTLSVKGSAPVLVIVLVVALVFILILILLLLLWCYRNKKDKCSERSRAANQTSAGDHVTHTLTPEEITYSHIELKNTSLKKKRNQEDTCVYSEVRTRSAAGVHLINITKLKYDRKFN
ncbi:LOW QUALITY PROTEIN: uncharacterized protein LOC110162470 [Boleophthalmus pectinirostris]|uniref:LOW QUALITY PROTEIN: uncharacterized protein LOC110162470 n=1 Tax=Boleophthalmus pectinirostris TaxID=150288 RepID=UPI00242F034F|nr:LOW QUALITY PROTEIN: uncharacterized protein LOC110162470 [Boleophthalmus pectinirostris]